MRRRKHQAGSIWLRGSNWYLRYYGSDRKQKTEFLHEKDEKFHSKTCQPVKKLASEVMARVNSGMQASNLSPTISEFWSSIYEPFIESSKRASTIKSYKDIWLRHLKPSIGDIRMGEYRSHQATELLTKASGKLGRNSVNHIRGLLSGIFSHATALGRIEHNPIRDAKSLVKAKAPAATPYYSLDELENIITALADDPEAQLMMALAGFLGLRPSEICGLRFEDLTENAVHIRRAVVTGVEGPTKTDGSVGSLPLIDVVRIPLALWRLKLGSPDSGWVFPNTHGKPINLRDFYVKRIRPRLKAGQWKGLYAGRRTAATLLTQLTGNPMAAAQLLRHQDYSLTMRAYAKQDRKELTSGLQLLESSLKKQD